jgi:hypothetical protein
LNWWNVMKEKESIDEKSGNFGEKRAIGENLFNA